MTKGEATKAARAIVKLLFDDLNDRRGFHVDTLDDEVRDGMRRKWIEIIVSRLTGRK